MKQSLLLCMVMLGLAVSASAQRVPTFRQYPATVERATAKSIDFRHSPGARSFRTRLSAALSEGVNFAGRYIFTGWGCGTGCISCAIIDARTGRVYFPEPIGGIAVGSTDAGDYVDQPVQYKKNSRLLILNGTPGTQIDRPSYPPEGEYYYEWRNNRLRLIRSIPHKRN